MTEQEWLTFHNEIAASMQRTMSKYTDEVVAQLTERKKVLDSISWWLQLIVVLLGLILWRVW